MDVLDELRWQARTSTAWLESVVRDVSQEQALWRPPGRTNSIAATYAHIVRNIDEDINQRLFRRRLLSEQAWSGQTGITPSGPTEWEQTTRFDWPQLRAYGRAMTAFLVETVENLTDQDLELVADLSTPDILVWHGLDIVRLSAGHHMRMHGGEIACLKGLQGSKGYLDGLDLGGP